MAIIAFAKSILDSVVFTAFERRFANNLKDLWDIYIAVCNRGQRDLSETVAAGMGILMIEEAERILGNRPSFRRWKDGCLAAPEKIWRAYLEIPRGHGTSNRIMFLSDVIDTHEKSRI